MGFLDSAQDMLDRGVTVAKGAVSTVAGEQLSFVRGMSRMCQAGCAAGYHERNGGNASYRLTQADVDAARSFFYDTPSSWVPLTFPVPGMAMEFLLVTAAGAHLRNVHDDPISNLGIIEVNTVGDAWRVVWGFKDGRQPTSEICAHLAAHAARKQATKAASRVLYHAHPSALVALTSLVPADACTLTRVLWMSLTESVIAIPGGVGVLGWMVPGSVELARATAEELSRYEACVWQLHGIFASGVTFDDALGLIEAVDKAADVYLRARSAQGGNPNVPFALTDADVRATAQAYNLPLRREFLR